ncbi:helix-turn-helix domain-containing protein [Mesonia ostreae]|uniref:ATP-binding protein n=1 Tax=Mesonia ostreae TaxID=861110 RepID=A0ABU2KMI1_9FLAO|nr:MULTISPECIES: ATP-binding protein [Flavobacteriaceae]MDT0295918.1 ATP-binding protein [Mesonia ostreae]
MKIENESDLENLIINQIEENIHLDYKASGSLAKSDGKKDEISRDVSSFANSNGGIIIYGIAEFNEKEKSHLPEKINAVDRTQFPKEWLENIINGRISPKIDGIIIQSIPIQESSNSVVYIVRIPKSTTAHQASDFRYYKRSNFGKNPMYDYEVKDVMNRNKSPKIEIILEVEKYKYEVKPPIPQITFQINREEKQEKEYSVINTLNVYAKNVGGIFADYVNCFLEIPVSILKEEEYNHRSSVIKDGIEYKRIFCDNTIREIKDVKNFGTFNTYDYWPSRYDPILPETQFRLDEIKFKKDIEFNNEIIFWEVYADNSVKANGEISISELKTIEKQKSE